MISAYSSKKILVILDQIVLLSIIVILGCDLLKSLYVEINGFDTN